MPSILANSILFGIIFHNTITHYVYESPASPYVATTAFLRTDDTFLLILSINVKTNELIHLSDSLRSS